PLASQSIPTDERAAQRKEGPVNVDAPFVANGQTPKPIEPAQGPLHDPPVPAKSLTRFHTPSGNARSDAPLPARRPTAGIVIPFVGVQLERAFAGTSSLSADGRDRI